MRSVQVLVAGGGASGMIAAITAAERGKQVVVIEKKQIAGKKLLATGNGRCNYTNRRQEPDCYHCGESGFVERVIGQFGVDETVDWFQRQGIMPKDRDGYMYPLSGQASSVRNVLARSMERAGVSLRCEETITEIIPAAKSGKGFAGYEVYTDKETYLAHSLILAMGGAAAPAQGTSGDAYPILQRLGVKLEKPLPALTSVELSERCCKAWAGVRINGHISLCLDGRLLGEDCGEIQMIAKGISGIPVFQLSALVSRQMAQGKHPVFVLDCLPDFSEAQLDAELQRRVDIFGDNSSLGDLLEGILPDKLAGALLGELHWKKKETAALLKQETLRHALIRQIKQKELQISQVSGFEKAQVTSGGVAVEEIHAETMELKRYPGLYITGEIVDVDGICGGYNLQWAWSSGHLAGMHVAKQGMDGEK